jgi:hypothetical protein
MNKARPGMAHRVKLPSMIREESPMAAAPHMADYLGVPLSREPKKRQRTMKLDVPQMVAGLALCLAVSLLWMAINDDPPARESTAVVPSNVAVAAKPVDPPATTSQAIAPPAIPPEPDNRAASALPTDSATITIIDGKTGAKKEVVVSAPAVSVASSAATTSTSAMASRTVGEKDSTIAPPDSSIIWPDTSASLPDPRGAATIAAATTSAPSSSKPISSSPESNDLIHEVMPTVASLNGSIPLPRRRPAPFAMVQNTAISSVPLPRVRPQETPAPEPMNNTTAEIISDTALGYEPGLSLGR